VAVTDDSDERARRAAELKAAEQGLLFEDEVAPLVEDVGYRGPTACAAAGITYRQLDYWARTGLVEPSVRPARGSGSQRLYGFRDILVLRVVKSLLDTGISLQQIRSAVTFLREHGATDLAHITLMSDGASDLARITLMSDGASVYACTSRDEVVDLLQGGQGVFGIALGRIWQDVEGSLAEFPADNAAGEAAVTQPEQQRSATDELASRRARKIS